MTGVRDFVSDLLLGRHHVGLILEMWLGVSNRREVSVDIASEARAADDEVEDRFGLHGEESAASPAARGVTHDEEGVADSGRVRVGEPALDHADHDDDERGSKVTKAPALYRANQ